MQLRSTYLALVLALFISCNKDDDDKPICHITAVTQTGSGGSSSTINFTYNNEGKLASIVEKNGARTYTYNGNTILINKTRQNGSFDGRDSITLDNKGKPLNIRQFNNQSGTSWQNIAFTYNGNELAKYVSTTSSGDTSTTTATYQNGNLVLLQSSSSVALLEYLTDKKAQAGDYLDILTLTQYGVPIFPHKNLVKSFSESGNTTTLTYLFNDDGQISKIVGTRDGDVNTLEYTYQCN